MSETDLDEIRTRVTQVLDIYHTYDSEMAHCLEDVLYVTVLRAVAEGHSHAQAMAVEALRLADSTHIRGYRRWTA